MKNRFIVLFAVVSGALTFLAIASSNAQETSASFAGGSVKIGDDNRACAPSIEGAIRYTAATNIIEFCNGTAWTSGSGGSTPCTIGDAVGDGICAGRYQDQNLIAAPAGCNNGDTVAADCDGTDDLEPWGYNGWGDLSNSLVDMVQANADYKTEMGGTNSTKAAGSCEGLALDGETWYLPTLPQLLILQQNKGTGSWTNGGFSADDYWSVNIRGSNQALAVDFSDGDVSSVNSDWANESFRCVRLE